MSASIAILAQAKGDVNLQDNNGRTPLHFASRQGHTWAVDRLINLRADVNAHQQVDFHSLLLHFPCSKLHILKCVLNRT